MPSPANLIRSGRVAAYLRLRGVPFEGRPYLYGKLPVIRPGARVRIGRDVRIDSPTVPIDLGTSPEGLIELGDHCGLNAGVSIFAVERVTIGDHAALAASVAIYDTDFHQVEAERPVRVAPVRIGNGVWIGRGAMILPGVTIGDGAVIAAGAIVNSDIPDRMLAAGVPAAPIRSLQPLDAIRS